MLKDKLGNDLAPLCMTSFVAVVIAGMTPNLNSTGNCAFQTPLGPIGRHACHHMCSGKQPSSPVGEADKMRGSPMALASPWTMLRTPLGMPALCPSSASASAVKGVDSAGFKMTCAMPTGHTLNSRSTHLSDAGKTLGPGAARSEPPDRRQGYPGHGPPRQSPPALPECRCGNCASRARA